MSEIGIAAGCVPAWAGTAMAKASAANSVNSAGPTRRRKGVDKGLLPEVMVVFIGVRFLSCIREQFLDAAFGLIEYLRVDGCGFKAPAQSARAAVAGLCWTCRSKAATCWST